MVPMLDDPCIDVLSLRGGRIGVSPISIQLLAILIHRSKTSFLFHLGICFQMLSVLYSRRLVSAVVLFRVRF